MEFIKTMWKRFRNKLKRWAKSGPILATITVNHDEVKTVTIPGGVLKISNSGGARVVVVVTKA